MSLKVSFTWIGLVVFALPMLINIAYAIFPPAEKSNHTAKVPRWVEIVEQVSRIAYLFAITLLVSQRQLSFHSVWFFLAGCFLILYYVVWIRYFAGRRKTALLRRTFLFIPMPLALFPVLYFLCASIWLHNIPAMILMIIFGAAHLTVSFQSFQ